MKVEGRIPVGVPGASNGLTSTEEFFNERNNRMVLSEFGGGQPIDDLHRLCRSLYDDDLDPHRGFSRIRFGHDPGERAISWLDAIRN